MIVAINPIHFFKCQRSIEYTNLTNPSPKILVMDNGIIDSKSSLSAMLLKGYYQKLEKHPNTGVSDTEYKTIIKNNQDSNGQISCAYCTEKFPESQITVDHFKPKVFKGMNQFFNIRLACKNCNTIKGGIYPARMPMTFALYLDKMRNKTRTNCLLLLKEAQETLKVDEIEASLINRLILMEIKWRVKQKEKVEEAA